jgi:hypothetical protein
MAIHYEYGDKTVRELVSHFREGRLNLEPGFQRKSVWSKSDRQKLIRPLLEGYPTPSIFLYKNRNERGEEVYDVIDGKQRLESILFYQGVGRFRLGRFSVRSQVDPEEKSTDWDWRKIRKRGHEHRLMSYKMQTVEVSGEFSEVVELFLRINSTGKKLTGAEKRHARYYENRILRSADRLATLWRYYFVTNRVLSPEQINRMKDTELVCEMLASIYREGPINKKTELDRIIGGQSIDGRSLQRCGQEFGRTMRLVKRVFPNLKSTRFANAVDFYSLFLMVWDLYRRRSVLTDGARNAKAQQLLAWLSHGVDRVRQQHRRMEGVQPEQALFRDYLLTIKGDTDSESTRTRRAEILKQVFGGLFERKDAQRVFSAEQRRLIWNSDETQRCRRCGEVLTWDDFTVDHVRSWARGGPTVLSNAALMCRSCNARKGAD